MAHMRQALVLVFMSLSLFAEEPAILRSVEPDYGTDADSKPYKTEQVKIKLMLAPDGRPYGIADSSKKLPDPVVIALSRYIFDVKGKARTTTLKYDVRFYGKEKPKVSGPAEKTVQEHLRKAVPPVYPQDLRERGKQGIIKLLAVIGKTGKIESLIAKGGPPEFYAAAATACRQWEFAPFVADGQPIEVQAELTVLFQLGGIKFIPPQVAL